MSRRPLDTGVVLYGAPLDSGVYIYAAPLEPVPLDPWKPQTGEPWKPLDLSPFDRVHVWKWEAGPPPNNVDRILLFDGKVVGEALRLPGATSYWRWAVEDGVAREWKQEWRWMELRYP